MLKGILEQQLGRTFNMFFTSHYSNQLLQGIHKHRIIFSSNANPLKIFAFSHACKSSPHWYKNSSFSLSFIISSSCTYRSVNYLYRQELRFTVLFLNPHLSYTLNLFIISPQLSNAISLPMCNWQRHVWHCNGNPFEILENMSEKQVLVPLVVVRAVMVSDFFMISQTTDLRCFKNTDANCMISYPVC